MPLPSLSVETLFEYQGIIKLYHFTDRSNIQSIIDNGGLYSWKACQKNGIIVQRPGGNNDSRALDARKGLENYVRLCFTPNHPMKFVAQNDGRINDPVILEIALSVADLPTTKFSDRNANKNGAIIATGYNGANNIHFATIRQQNHFNLTDDEKEFYQAEVLVLEKIPLLYITNIDAFRPHLISTGPYGKESCRSLFPNTKGSNSTPKNHKNLHPSSSGKNNTIETESESYGCLIWIILGIILTIIYNCCK